LGAELANDLEGMTNGIEELIRDLTVYFFFAYFVRKNCLGKRDRKRETNLRGAILPHTAPTHSRR
jgi:hypothetical protein